MFCIKCGNKTTEGVQFCSKCGHSANAADPQPSNTQATTPPAQLNKAGSGLRSFGGLCLAICAILAAISSFLGLGIPLLVVQVLAIIGVGYIIISLVMQMISRFSNK